MKEFSAFWADRFEDHRIKELDARYVPLGDLEPVIERLSLNIPVSVIGKSFEERPIYMFSIGSGRQNVLAWSCMHGNETTALRGWMDWIEYQYFEPDNMFFYSLLREFTIHFIPMLNPDGAQRYARRNAMQIDPNRDARALVSPEMKSLFRQIDLLKPALAFNLHDQRNIFAVNNKAATISFLAPSVDVARTVSPERIQTMDLIGAAAKAIEPFLNGGIGRYTDEYYPTAVGECVQQMGIPTILVECGASSDQEDFLRQRGRMLNPIILHAVLNRLASNALPSDSVYNSIPLNQANQVDVLLKKVRFTLNGRAFFADVALLEELSLRDGALQIVFKINDLGDLHHLIGIEEFTSITDGLDFELKVGGLASFTLQTDKGELCFENGVKRKARFS